MKAYSSVRLQGSPAVGRLVEYLLRNLRSASTTPGSESSTSLVGSSVPSVYTTSLQRVRSQGRERRDGMSPQIRFRAGCLQSNSPMVDTLSNTSVPTGTSALWTRVQHDGVNPIGEKERPGVKGVDILPCNVFQLFLKVWYIE